MWRPEKWLSVKPGFRMWKNFPLKSTHEAFEAGADAMLEALRRKGISDFPLVCGGCGNRHSPEVACLPRRKPEQGITVFIPDELQS